jgi:hypothetical protein
MWLIHSASQLLTWASSPGSERCEAIIFDTCWCDIDRELQKEPENIGQVLAALASDIQKRETQLNEIRLRERRATLLVTMYTFAGWGAYLGLWYAQLLPQMSGHRPNSKVEKAVKGFPAILGPIMYVILPLLSAIHDQSYFSRILFTRRIVQLWYNRKGDAEGPWRFFCQPRVGLVPTFTTFQRRA